MVADGCDPPAALAKVGHELIPIGETLCKVVRMSTIAEIEPQPTRRSKPGHTTSAAGGEHLKPTK
jgi:hypothetical protein